MSDDEERQTEMVDIAAQLEERFEYVVTMMRQIDVTIDEPDGKGAFAFILGVDSENCLIIEGNLTGDGNEAQATIYGIQEGRRGEISTFELDGQIMHSMIVRN